MDTVNIMNIRYNSKMKLFFNDKSNLKYIDKKKIHTEIDNIITNIFDYGDYLIVNNNGDEKLSKNQIFDQYNDYTGYECFCNEIYIDVKRKKYFYPMLVCSINYLIKQLSLKISNKTFNIIVSIDDGEYKNIVLKFCLYRKNEFYLCDNIEAYCQPVLSIICQTYNNAFIN